MSNGSFGRDPQQLQNIPAFRGQSLAQQAAMGNYARERYNEERAKNGGGGGGFVPSFVDRYMPTKVGYDFVRLVPGVYEVEVVDPDNVEGTMLVKQSYMTAVEHKSQITLKVGYCAAGPHRRSKALARECGGCRVFWEDFNLHKKGGAGRMNARELQVFSVLDYGLYGLMNRMDKDFQPIIDNRTGEPYKEWRKLLGKTDPYYRYAEEFSEGRLLHWELGYQHFNKLLAYSQSIATGCANCGGDEGSINVEAYTCTHCGNAVIDMLNTTLTPADIANVVAKPASCPTCRRVSVLQPESLCKHCGPEAKPLTIFDVDLKIQRVVTGTGENTNSQLEILSYKARPIADKFAAMAKPKPLGRIYAPTPAKNWAKVWGPPAASGQEPDERPAQGRPQGRPQGGGGGYQQQQQGRGRGSAPWGARGGRPVPQQPPPPPSDDYGNPDDDYGEYEDSSHIPY